MRIVVHNNHFQDESQVHEEIAAERLHPVAMQW